MGIAAHYTINVLFAKEVIPVAHFSVKLEPAFGHRFKKPVYLVPVPGGRASNRVALLEKGGRLVFIEKNRVNFDRAEAINFTNRTLTSGWEEGALGLAFAPDFLQSKRLYIYYSRSSPRRTVLARFTLPNYKPGLPFAKTDFKAKEETLLEIRQPFANHNGGMLEFGADGFLYIGVGDGGSGGDPRGYAQNLNSLLGKILRIDVNTSDASYKIPADNPFSQNEKSGTCPDLLCREEIYAWGLRNPWRFTILPNGDLIVGDVGQNHYEEITLVRKGENHGWNKMEGFHCFEPKKNCKKEGLTLPLFEYDHNEGSSILGGLVYTGNALPKLTGQYIFGDSMVGKIWSVELKPPYKKVLLHQAPILLSSFGYDHEHNIYALDLNKGFIYKISTNFQQMEK